MYDRIYIFVFVVVLSNESNSNGNEEVPHTPQSYWTGASPSI